MSTSQSETQGLTYIEADAEGIRKNFCIEILLCLENLRLLKSIVYITCSFTFYIDNFLNQNLVLDRRV